ncbi:MAG: carboxypeptidase-like regulatory domain-containing protein, partial [Candidatus Marinimicrobia bacterium]|nr:carboxypeptidase-like regulatory domain-containing protein [Candidatus Neomarinimicrobiota bacterium]
MAKRLLFKPALIGVLCTLFATTLFAQKPRNISGTLVDSDGNSVAQTTVLLLGDDGTEVQRTETSKKRLGRGGGKFEFKKVLPGNYTLEADAGNAGKGNIAVEVADKNVKLGDMALTGGDTGDAPAEPAGDDAAGGDAAAAEGPGPDAIEFKPDPGKDYILNELSFEIKKMTAELKYLNEELENLKALSKMWVNPLAIYSKEIIMKNGSTVFGKVVYQDEESLKVETLVGYLIINRQDIVRIIDNIVTEEQAEYVPEQVRDSYT